MTSVGDDQLRPHLFLSFEVHGAEQRFDVSDSLSRNGPVTDILGEPGKVLVQHFCVFLVEQVNQVHLSHDDHAALIPVQAVDERLIVFIVYAESLVTGDDAGFGEFRDRKFEERVADRYVDVDWASSMMIQF